jgi:hypothetical protein
MGRPMLAGFCTVNCFFTDMPIALQNMSLLLHEKRGQYNFNLQKVQSFDPRQFSHSKYIFHDCKKLAKNI